MTLLRRLSFPASLTLVAASLSLFGCSQSADDGDTSEGAATVGVPTAPILGTATYTATGITFTFASGLVRTSTGADPLTMSDGNWGPALNKTREQTYGWFTNTKWNCQQAEKWATGTATSPATQDCYFEINTTANNGFSVVIVGLDAQGNGLSSWVGTPGAAHPAAVNGGQPALISAAPPGYLAAQAKVNVTIDHDGMLAAMKAATQRFNAPVAERNDCLKNARASSWLDIQAHYYCLLPLNTVRQCYSSKLVEISSSTDPNVAKTAATEAYKACITNGTNADQQWIRDNQEAAFKYAMFAKQGVIDFNLESENKVVNDYYASMNQTRERRVTDTYPAWLPEQPRYEVIRAAQVAAQAAGH